MFFMHYCGNAALLMLIGSQSMSRDGGTGGEGAYALPPPSDLWQDRARTSVLGQRAPLGSVVALHYDLPTQIFRPCAIRELSTCTNKLINLVRSLVLCTKEIQQTVSQGAYGLTLTIKKLGLNQTGHMSLLTGQD